MRTVEQISRGLADFFDEEIRPSLSGGKGILYGVAVGTVLSNPHKLIGKYEPMLEMMGIMENGQIDAEGIAAELKRQMEKSGGSLSITVLNDEFKFVLRDVDSLLECIERA